MSAIITRRRADSVSDYTEAYCKRGHLASGTVISVKGRMDLNGPVDKFCAQCGAGVILGCSECSAPFPAPAGFTTNMDPDPFCRQCGSPQSWTSREKRVLQLANLLEDENLDEATRLAATEAIAELAEPVTGDEASDSELEDRQVAATGRLKSLAPGAWEFLSPVVQSLVTDAVKRRAGLA